MLSLLRTNIVTNQSKKSVSCLRYVMPMACQQRNWSDKCEKYVGITRRNNASTEALLSIKASEFWSLSSYRYIASKKSSPSSDTSTQKNSESVPPPPANTNYLWIALASAIAGIGLAYILYGNDSSDNSTKDSSTKNVKKNVPPTSDQIPKKVPYLLIGGGTASFAAFRAIKSHDPKAKVLVITKEYQMPYMRPPLSKEIWRNNGTDLKFKQWNGAERSLFFEPDDFYVDPTKLLEEPNGGVAIVRGYTVKYIDVAGQKAVLTDGTEIEYDECLLGIGSEPENLPIFQSASPELRSKVSVFKTIDDFEKVRKILDRSNSVAVIGGGFLGSELACALAKYRDSGKLKVYQIFHEGGNMGKILPEYLSQWATERVKDEGVDVISKTQVGNVELENSKVKLKLLNNKSVLVDHVIVAVGSKPDVKLAEESGLEVDSKHGGYLVNAELEARSHLFVAGDAACFFDIKLGRRRVEHHDHAVVSGRLAGENMVGKKKPFTHQSMFWSDLGPHVGYEAIGLVDATLPTVGVFAKSSDTEKSIKSTDNLQISESVAPENSLKEPKSSLPITESTITKPESESDINNYNKGVIFYLKDEKVVGIVLWNVFNRINTARSIIAEGKKFDDLNEVAKLFEIHA